MRHPNLEWLFWVPLLACPAVQAQGTSPETLLDKPAVAPVHETLPSVGALRSEAATSFVGNRTLFLAIAIWVSPREARSTRRAERGMPAMLTRMRATSYQPAGLTLTQKTIANFVAKALRLDEQEPPSQDEAPWRKQAEAGWLVLRSSIKSV